MIQKQEHLASLKGKKYKTKGLINLDITIGMHLPMEETRLRGKRAWEHDRR